MLILNKRILPSYCKHKKLFHDFIRNTYKRNIYLILKKSHHIALVHFICYFINSFPDFVEKPHYSFTTQCRCIGSLRQFYI